MKAYLQNMVYTTLPEATIIIVTFNNLFLYITNFIPGPETQVKFNESVNSFTLSFFSGTTDRKVVNTGLECQLEKASLVKVNSPKFIIAARQREARSACKQNNVSVFDLVEVKKYFVEMDGIRHPKDSINIDYATNEYHGQYRNLKLFF